MRQLFTLALVLAIAAPVAACPSHNSRRANLRACYANQKTVAGAIEMFSLDRNCRVEDHVRQGDGPAAFAGTGPCASDVHRHPPKPSPHELLSIPPGLWDALKGQGYLQSIPEDPDRGRGTRDHYLLVTFGNGVFCTHHGAIQTRSALRSPYEQLLGEGFDRKFIPQSVSREDPTYAPWFENPPVEPILLLAMLLGFLWAFLRGMGDRERSACGMAFTSMAWGSLWLLTAVPWALVKLPFVPAIGLTSQIGGFGGALAVAVFRVAGALFVRPRPEARAAPRTPPAPKRLASAAGLRCAVCAAEGGPSRWVTCPACDAAHHAECWTFQDGCAAFGCTMAHGRWRSGNALPARTVRRDEPAKAAPGVSWLS